MSGNFGLYSGAAIWDGVEAPTMGPSDHAILDPLQRRLGYAFRDRDLLRRALTHPSYLADHPEAGPGNQRLEFLGDAVLQLILTEALYAIYPDEREGPLSRRRAALTKGRFLSGLARDLGLDPALRLGRSEEQTGGRQRDSILEDGLEALVGAIFLDSDFATARRAVLGWYGPLAGRLDRVLDEENPKGRLQELVQPDFGNDALRYDLVRTAGAAHEREYEVAVFLGDRRLGAGSGSSKKNAEESAARAALATLRGRAAEIPPA